MKYLKFLVVLASLGVVLSLLMPRVVVAANQAATTKTETGWSHAICVAETSTGICDNNGTPDIYVPVDKYDILTFSLKEAGGAGSSCDIYATLQNDDIPGTADLSSFAANKINSTALSLAQDKITFSNVSFMYVWINCTAIGGTSTTVEMQGSVSITRIKR